MAEKPIIIVGGGGHTSAIIGVLKANGAALRGIVTRDSTLVGGEIHGIPVLGVEDFYKLDPGGVTIVSGVGNKPSRLGSGLEARSLLHKRYLDAGFEVLPVMSAQAIFQPDIQLGHAVQIMPGAVIEAGAMIGDNALINTGALIDHDVVVAPHAHVAPGAILCGGVSVGELTHIGAGAIIIQGIKIGRGVVIGAGVVVRRDVPDNTIAIE